MIIDRLLRSSLVCGNVAWHFIVMLWVHGFSCLVLAVEMIELLLSLFVVLSFMLVCYLLMRWRKIQSQHWCLHWYCTELGGLLRCLPWLLSLGHRTDVRLRTMDGWYWERSSSAIRASLSVDVDSHVRIGFWDVNDLVKAGGHLVLVDVNGLLITGCG